MKIPIILSVAALLLVGCSQEEAPPAPPPADTEPAEEQAAAPAPAPVAATTPQPALNDVVLQDLNDIEVSLESENYDAAVSTLSAVNQLDMTPEQRAAYRRQLQMTQDYLIQRMQTDQQARDAYNRLGRQSMGR